MFKEVTPEEADPLSLAGLLWYSVVGSAWAAAPAPWQDASEWKPTAAQKAFGDYRFFILLEE